ncbi:hypothetical protein [Microbispora sp. CA-102843]|uniref:hypothetical protein n=1 Tax=Microbispora sp. CA-102843 TaxID=3239952 RepID=UPI003D8CDE1B
MDIAEILGQIRRPTSTVPLCLRGDLMAVWEQLDREFREANTSVDDEVTASGRSAKAAKLAREMEDLRREMQAATRVFVLQAARRPDWLRMVKEHSRNEDGDDLNQESFSVAIVAACCTDPVMTPAQAEQLKDELTDGQWEELAKAVMRLNRTSPGVPFSTAAAVEAALGA